ncbi:MAG: serine protease [Acidimicrobiales bacterium]
MHPSRHPSNTPTPSRRRARFASAAAVAAATAAVVTIAGHLPASAIVDGDPTSITSAPWQVSLRDGAGHFCGGAVIDATTVLTAAHCVEGASAGSFVVRAGVTDRDDSSGQDRAVVRIVVHPGGFDAAADVALLTLASPLQFGSTVQPIALASSDELAAASTASVSGWGAVAEDDAEGSEGLLSAQVPIVDDATCATQLGGDGEIVASNEVCAEGIGAGSCYGDSGGPLTIVAPDGTVKLAGVVSWGVACAVMPGVFAEVPTFAPWITSGGVGGEPLDGAADGSDAADGWDLPDGGTYEDGTDDGWDDGWEDDGWGDDGWGDDGTYDDGYDDGYDDDSYDAVPCDETQDAA